MPRGLVLSLLAALFSVSASAQYLDDSLLERMAGKWVLKGTIGGKQTTHDVTAQWVLAHQYLCIQEVSREKDSTGRPEYEATVYIGRDDTTAGFACLWLDNTGGTGLAGHAIGHGRRRGDRIPFLFKGKDGSRFHTTFVYIGQADSWQWVMDGEEGGKLQPFARLALTRE